MNALLYTLKKVSLLILMLSTISASAQMLPLEERYAIVYKNLEKKEHKKEIAKTLAHVLENKYILKEVEKTLSDSYNKTLSKKLLILFTTILYEEENTKQIKGSFQDLLQDETFKLELLKIIKSENNSQKIFQTLNQHFNKKFNKKLTPFFKRYFKDKLLCQHNISLAFHVFSKNLVSNNTYEQLKTYYQENPIDEKYSDKFKQKIVSLPYDYSLNNWFHFYLKTALKNIKKGFLNKKDSKLFLSPMIEKITLQLVYETLKNDQFIEKYAQEFKLDFLSDKKKLKFMLKSLILDDSEEIYKKMNEKRFNCFHLSEKMFKIDSGLLSLYVQEMLKTEISKKVLLILFKSLK